MFTKLFRTAAITLAMSLAWNSAQATVVEVHTSLGNFEIHLYDHNADVKPTVDNFLAYMTGAEGYGSYEGALIHRSVPGFILQTGGFHFNHAGVIDNIAKAPAIRNAPVFSNVKGTLAMAKAASSQHSATSEWFINLSDNSGNLDSQNGGFTVFGEVTRGMDVVNAIAALPRVNIGLGFDTVPVKSWQTGEDLERDHFVIIETMVVTNSNPNSGTSLSPVLRKGSGGGSGGGGAVGLATLGLLAGLFGLGLQRRVRVGGKS